MHYRNIAEATGIRFAFDLTQLPAVAEDQLIDAINRRDKNIVVIEQPDPFANDLFRT